MNSPRFVLFFRLDPYGRKITQLNCVKFYRFEAVICKRKKLQGNLSDRTLLGGHRLVVLKFSEQLVVIVVFLSECVSYHVIGSGTKFECYINGRKVSTYLS